jgi:hypothetical protein
MTTPIGSVNWGEIARGLGDLLVYPLASGDTAGAGIDITGIRTLEWSIESDSDELEGDNTVIAIARSPKKGSGTVELGKNHLAAYAVMFGGVAATVSGTGGAEIAMYEEPATSAAVYFAMIGQTPSMDSSGSAYRVTIYKALASTPSESLAQSEWNTPSIDFECIPNLTNKFIKREQFETEVPIPTTFPP